MAAGTEKAAARHMEAVPEEEGGASGMQTVQSQEGEGASCIAKPGWVGSCSPGAVAQAVQMGQEAREHRPGSVAGSAMPWCRAAGRREAGWRAAHPRCSCWTSRPTAGPGRQPAGAVDAARRQSGHSTAVTGAARAGGTVAGHMKAGRSCLEEAAAAAVHTPPLAEEARSPAAEEGHIPMVGERHSPAAGEHRSLRAVAAARSRTWWTVGVL